MSLPALFGAAASDALNAYAFTLANLGGQVVGVALNALFAGRLNKGRQILLEQLRKGEKTLQQVGELEEAVAMVYRYGRAALEGSAKLNLRLMAKVMAGQAHVGNLIADDFLSYADLLASLRREEIIFLA